MGIGGEVRMGDQKAERRKAEDRRHKEDDKWIKLCMGNGVWYSGGKLLLPRVQRLSSRGVVELVILTRRLFLLGRLQRRFKADNADILSVKTEADDIDLSVEGELIR